MASNIAADSEISSQISLLNQEGSSVLFGNILLVPIERSIIYVRPLYVQAVQNPLPKLVRVIAVYGNRAVMKNTLAEALAELFPGAPATLEQSPGTAAPPPDGSPPPTGPLAPSAAVGDLIARADTAFVAAQAALQKGDLAGYQGKVNEAAELVRQAGLQAAATSPAGPDTTGATGTPPTTATAATTTTPAVEPAATTTTTASG